MRHVLRFMNRLPHKVSNRHILPIGKNITGSETQRMLHFDYFGSVAICELSLH